jgi:capsule biosynthesis phosphatase
MIHKENVLVMDLDGTLCPIKKPDERYEELIPCPDVLTKLLEYREKGFYIIIQTARSMRTYEGNVGRINANTAKTVFQWLDRHSIPYDEVHFGKPWSGKGGFYVDDKAIRPDEFVNLTHDEILRMISK